MSGKYGHIELSLPELSPENLRFLTFKSPALKNRGDVTLFVPDGFEDLRNLSPIMLLHGVYGSHWAWTMKGGVHLTAQRLIDEKRIQPLVIAMPSDGLFGDGSGYFAHNQSDFENWIVKDVIGCVTEVLPCLDSQSKLFIAGLSMGGFGALRLGAKYADKFAGISAHSAFTKAAQLQMFVENPLSDYGEVDDEELDALFWIKKNRAQLPALRFDCGVDDELIAANRELHRELEINNIAHVYQEFAGGHSWNYWAQHVTDSLLFFAAQK